MALFKSHQPFRYRDRMREGGTTDEDGHLIIVVKNNIPSSFNPSLPYSIPLSLILSPPAFSPSVPPSPLMQSLLLSLPPSPLDPASPSTLDLSPQSLLLSIPPSLPQSLFSLPSSFSLPLPPSLIAFLTPSFSHSFCSLRGKEEAIHYYEVARLV